MTIQEIIQKDLTETIINKDIFKRDLLRVVIAEMLRNTKVATDEEAIKVLKKQIESAELCGTLNEIPILQSYLPATMTDEEMKVIFLRVLEVSHMNPKTASIGDMMKSAKEVFGKQFDGKRITKILKEI